MHSIPDTGFAGDDGAVPAEVAAALVAYAADPDGRHRATLAALQEVRVLVPVVALLGEVERDGPGRVHDKSSDQTSDKTTDMATVLVTGQDGRTALLAFSGTASMTAWNPQARPVPVTLREAARAALHERAAALVLDLAGPVLFAIEDADLRALGDGFMLTVLAGEWRWARPGDQIDHEGEVGPIG